MVISTVIMPIVCPSGGAVAMAEWPTTPEPPVRFTTFTGWPRSRSRMEATMRAVASVPPPAPQGTMKVSGRLGKAACAEAGPSSRPAARAGRGREEPAPGE